MPLERDKQRLVRAHLSAECFKRPMRLERDKQRLVRAHLSAECVKRSMRPRKAERASACKGLMPGQVQAGTGRATPAPAQTRASSETPGRARISLIGRQIPSFCTTCPQEVRRAAAPAALTFSPAPPCQ